MAYMLRLVILQFKEEKEKNPDVNFYQFFFANQMNLIHAMSEGFERNEYHFFICGSMFWGWVIFICL